MGLLKSLQSVRNLRPPLSEAECTSSNLKSLPLSLLNKGEHYKDEDKICRFNMNEEMKVHYFSKKEQEEHTVRIVNGRLIDSQGKPFSTQDATETLFAKTKKTGKAIFVIDRSGRMIVSKKSEAGKIHHSTLAAGESVFMAGTIEADEEGKITYYDDKSGPLNIKSEYEVPTSVPLPVAIPAGN